MPNSTISLELNGLLSVSPNIGEFEKTSFVLIGLKKPVYIVYAKCLLLFSLYFLDKYFLCKLHYMPVFLFLYQSLPYLQKTLYKSIFHLDCACWNLKD